MIVGWDSEKLWAALKKIQLWSLIPLQKQITYLTNDIFLPIHALFKWDDWETAWVFRMCRGGDDYLFLTGLSDGQLALCINAFLEVPSRMRSTSWGLFETPPYIKWGQEGTRGFLFFFPAARILIQVKKKADWQPQGFLFTITGALISCSRVGMVCQLHAGLCRWN